MGRVINIGSSADFTGAIERAGDVLRKGGLVAYPTESFYGLAADATNSEAVERLFAVKKRGTDRPVLILIPSADLLERYVTDIPDVAAGLIERFWPGGLTLVFSAGREVLQVLTAGTGRIGIRLSSHPVATALAGSLGAPITGTSANISGSPSCSSAEEVALCLEDKVDLILDGGKTEGKTGSTVLDVTVSPPLILREGMVMREHLEDFL